MDRGFASKEIIKKISQKNQLFVIRIKANYTLLMLSDGWFLLGKKNPVRCRVVMFGDIATKKEYYLATNLPDNTSHSVGLGNEDVGEIYRKRWAIELL
jgi:transposase